nr:tRNA (adenosine(37)-N6)-dimethylallyltransferase MiaA [Candidatus Thiosymbion oneisti]
MGPTAAGKTDLAVALTARLPCDIISVDSAQIYKGMDIGTAKPGPEVLRKAPHRLLDICDPSESYSAARFCADAEHEMAQIVAAGRIPLLVGGTMLYFRALQEGLSRLPEADGAVRARLAAEAEAGGWAALHQRLAAVDPAAARRIHPNDPQRIQRALEVYELTGHPLSQLTGRHRRRVLPYRFLKLAHAPAERAVLHQRIERRFLNMLELGFEAEVRALWARGDLTLELPSMRCVGYRQMLKYLFSEYTFRDMVQRSISATRQLAKRQLTWLRSESDVHWICDRSDQGEPIDQALRLIRVEIR